MFKRDKLNISSHVGTKSKHVPPFVFHTQIQLSILKEWESFHRGGCLEYEVVDRGDGRRGFVDVVLFDGNLKVGVEIDRASPKLKSITKMKYFDIAIFILRSDKITDDRKHLIESKLSSFDKPFMLILLSQRMIINRIPENYNYISMFFRNWFAGMKGI